MTGQGKEYYIGNQTLAQFSRTRQDPSQCYLISDYKLSKSIQQTTLSSLMKYKVLPEMNKKTDIINSRNVVNECVWQHSDQFRIQSYFQTLVILDIHEHDFINSFYFFYRHTSRYYYIHKGYIYLKTRYLFAKIMQVLILKFQAKISKILVCVRIVAGGKTSFPIITPLGKKHDIMYECIQVGTHL